MKKFIVRRFFYLVCIITFLYSINYLRLQVKVKTKLSKTTRSELTQLIKFMFQMNAFFIEIPVLEKEHEKMKINKINQDFDGIFFKLDENQPAQKLTFGIFNETNDLNEIILPNLNQEV